MFLKRRKDIGQPVNSLEGLKYLSIIWFIIGTTTPNYTKKKRFLYYLYSVVMNVLCCIFFPTTMLLNLLVIESYKELVANLSITVTCVVSIIKQLVILVKRRYLLRSHELLEQLDKVYHPRQNARKHILNAIHAAQLFFLIYPIYFFCGWGFAYNGWRHHRPIYDAWFPDAFKNPEHNYWAAFIYQLTCQHFVGLQCIFNDIYPMCYLSLMIGHLESLAERIAEIGWQQSNHNKNIEDLRNCIRDHKILLAFFDCIRPLISITLFFQFLIAGMVLCLTAINLTLFSRDFNEQFFGILYLIIILIQMFPCCWKVNVLIEKSNYLTTAMYSCNWMNQNQKFRKMLIIFMQRSQKTNTILAGNLAPVTVQTFLAIIRFAFSMFTILNNM